MMLAAVLVGLCGLEQCWIVDCRHIYKNTSDPDRLRDMCGCRVSRTSVVDEHKVIITFQVLKNLDTFTIGIIAGVERWSYTNS